MKIKILGGGCSNCENLYKTVEQALTQLEVQAEVEKVQDMAKIMEYGVMKMPALVINEKVKASGMLPDIEQIKKYILEESN
ncbi:MAG: thioredoxin family protein [Clostridium sp.]|nr:thioredoxin family protein [Clostridium sp.]